MMILLFHVSGDNYGINVCDVIEVLPSVALKHFPHGPEYVSGLLNFRGRPVPVIDLTLLMSSHPSRDRISSRIVLVDYHNEGDVHHLLGLLVEKTTKTVRIPDHVFTRSGVETNDAPFLGDVAIHDGVMVQIVDIRRVLPESVKATLFYDHKESGAIVDGMEH